MNDENCLYCKRSSDDVPLIAVKFKQIDLMICSQHLPILIHDPSQLIGKLPGAEDLDASDYTD